jgi:anaerobic ribonucleoside-triphosphate reductase
VGFQTPFTNIIVDLCPPDILWDHPVIIGGIEQESTYSDYQPEMDMLNCAFAEVILTSSYSPGLSYGEGIG